MAMQELLGSVAGTTFDVEIALDQQIGVLPLPFPGMDSMHLPYDLSIFCSLCDGNFIMNFQVFSPNIFWEVVADSTCIFHKLTDENY